jgi:hypothetical protein
VSDFPLLNCEDWGQPEIDWDHPLTTGLGAAFDFSAGGGNAIEAVSGRQVARTSPATAAWGIGARGTYYGSDGTEYATITLPAINNWTSLTVGMLWKCAAAQPNNSRIIEKGANNDWSFTQQGTTNKVVFNFGLTTGPISTAAIFDGMWHVLHGTYDGTTATLYVDGVRDAALTVAGKTGTTNELNLFRYGGGGFQTASKLSGLWIWNRALIAGEVFSHSWSPRQLYRRRRRTIFAAATVGGGSATLSAATGVFGFSGNAANLLAGRVLGAAAGAYGLTGQAAALLSGRVLPAATGAFALTGNDAALLANRVIVASTGVYVLTGNAANLVYTQPGAGAYVLVADTGVFSLTGNDAGLLASRVLAAAPGSFALSSVGASLVWSGHITPSFVDPDEVTMITP